MQPAAVAPLHGPVFSDNSRAVSPPRLSSPYLNRYDATAAYHPGRAPLSPSTAAPIAPYPGVPVEQALPYWGGGDIYRPRSPYRASAGAHHRSPIVTTDDMLRAAAASAAAPHGQAPPLSPAVYQAPAGSLPVHHTGGYYSSNASLPVMSPGGGHQPSWRYPAAMETAQAVLLRSPTR